VRFDERLVNGMSVMAAVVEAKSFVGAAKALDMTQPGVSRAIARLEKRLGVRLFDRTTRVLQLTDDGRRFYECVVPLLVGLEEAAATAGCSTTRVRGHLRVNVCPLFARHVLGPRLGEFKREHPELQIELAARDRLGDLISEGFDLAVRFGHPRSPNLVARKLFETRVHTVAAPSFIERFGRPSAPLELETGNFPCIDYRDPESGQTFHWMFVRGQDIIDVKTSNMLIVNDVGTMHAVTLAGEAVAQVLAFGAEDLLADGRLVDLFPDWPDEHFPFFALYPSRSNLPAKTRVFLEFLVRLCS
jgi:DNA-binding transcriptional LysR family regulator